MLQDLVRNPLLKKAVVPLDKVTNVLPRELAVVKLMVLFQDLLSSQLTTKSVYLL